jgi:GTP cyclohydrolase I
MNERSHRKVKCRLCDKSFTVITGTHLKSAHQISMLEYREKFPGVQIVPKLIALEKANGTRGKTYQEIYDDEKANKLKEEKRIKATNQWKNNPNNLSIKKRSCDNKLKKDEEKKERKKKKEDDLRKVCKGCGCEYLMNPSNFNAYFCSHECFIDFSKKNAENYRIKAFANLPNECSFCQSKEKLLVHHKDKNFLNNDLENLMILCTKCHSKIHNPDRIASKNSPFSDDGLIRSIRGLLKSLRIDLSDENFKETPFRMVRSFYELLEGLYNEKEIEDILSSVFPSNYDGIVIAENIHCFSICPHHFLPVEYFIDVGYISKKFALGLSKISRLVELLAKRPVLQEVLTKDIISSFEKYLNPEGAIVHVKGRHYCMSMRGVKQKNSYTITSSLMGVFNIPATRLEFEELLKLSKTIR